MLIFVAHVQIFGDEQILLHIAGAAFKLYGLPIQLND